MKKIRGRGRDGAEEFWNDAAWVGRKQMWLEWRRGVGSRMDHPFYRVGVTSGNLIIFAPFCIVETRPIH